VFNKKVTKTLLYENVVKQIIETINMNEIAPGQRFPTERELSEKMGISRNVLREAFHILESRGLITSIQGKGRFLRKLPNDDLNSEDIAIELEKCSLLEIYEVRKILELNIMEILIRNVGDSDIYCIENIYHNMINEFVENNSTVGEFKIHLVYAEKTKNYYLKQMLNLTLELILEYMNTSFNAVVNEYELVHFIEDHSKIIKSIKDRNVAEAQKNMKEHLERTTSDIGRYRLKLDRTIILKRENSDIIQK